MRSLGSFIDRFIYSYKFTNSFWTFSKFEHFYGAVVLLLADSPPSGILCQSSSNQTPSITFISWFLSFISCSVCCPGWVPSMNQNPWPTLVLLCIPELQGDGKECRVTMHDIPAIYSGGQKISISFSWLSTDSKYIKMSSEGNCGPNWGKTTKSKFCFCQNFVLCALLAFGKNLGVDTFPDPVGHFGAPRWLFWILQPVRCCRRWVSAPFAARLVFLIMLPYTCTSYK